MRTRDALFCTLIAHVLAAVLPHDAAAQFFTRVTDPGNPVVNDALSSGGAVWFDADQDGDLDLFVANGNLASVNNSLYLNDGSGGFTKVLTGAIVTDGGSSIGATVGDYDRDGLLDLYVTNRSNFGNFLYQGAGGGAFTKVITGFPVTDANDSNMSSWVDINGDGELDLHVINFLGNNSHYRSSGPPGYTFTRVFFGSIVSDGTAPSIMGVWGDVDNDRSPDLFVGNGGSTNDVLHVNDGAGNFTTTTLNDARATLGASWGDYDNDGDLDLFAAHYLSQNNRIYRNSGAPNYTLDPIDTGIVSLDGGNSVGSTWSDFDNDGDLDLFVANDGQHNTLYQNLGPPTYAFQKVFGEIAVIGGGNSFGTVAGDYDRDGDLDLFVANRMGQANFLYRNEASGNAWLIVRCIGTMSNASAIGAKVRVKAVVGGAPRWMMREVAAQTGYNSQNLWLHFGLGDATVADSLLVEWPSGVTTVLAAVDVSQYLTVSEDGFVSSVVPRGEVGLQLLGARPNPFRGGTTIRYSLARASEVTLRVYDVGGRSVALLERGVRGAGEHAVRFRARAPGVYLYELSAGGVRLSGKMVHVR